MEGTTGAKQEQGGRAGAAEQFVAKAFLLPWSPQPPAALRYSLPSAGTCSSACGVAAHMGGDMGTGRNPYQRVPQAFLV